MSVLARIAATTLLLAAQALGATAHAAAFAVSGGFQELEIETTTGLPSRWVACDRPCIEPGARRMPLAGPGAGELRWRGGSPPPGGYQPRVTRTADAVRAELVPASGKPVVWEISLVSPRVVLTAPPGTGVGQVTGKAFAPEPLPGFGAAFSDVERVRVGAAGQSLLGDDGEVAPGEWSGYRQRFWAWLLRAGGDGRIEIYAGPVQWQRLAAVDPALTGMLFASLWEPFRWLCRGLYELLGLLLGVVGNPGLAIILLSLAVKVILSPLSAVADRWQRDVNRIQSRLQPKLAAIRAEFRGEEAHRRTLALYKEEGVHPLFTMKSLAGFAIQVPMFIAAFDMLADNIALSGASFLWVEDLAAPDRLAALPFAIPFFGAHLNGLPACMTAVTLLSAWLQRDDTLNEVLQRRQRLQLYLMAAAFFLLFYTFPAGMVLYWTANNAWHLAKEQALGWWRRR